MARNILELCREYDFGGRIGELKDMMRDALIIIFQYESHGEERTNESLFAILDALPVSIDLAGSIQEEE